MVESLRRLLTGIVDYAGIYPPASLPLDEAIEKYKNYLVGPHAWMLARFVCPAARLRELEGCDSPHAESSALPLSAIGRGGETPETFLAGWQADIQTIGEFNQAQAGRFVVSAFEVKLPSGPDESQAASELLAETKPSADSLEVFVEVGLADDWRERTTRILESVSAVRDYSAKLRTGGTDPCAFPSSEQVAHFVSECSRLRLPFKCTAGLHHPVRRFDSSVETTMHGFFNVFAAAVLAHARGLGADKIEQVLLEEDPGAFVFFEDGLECRGLRATLEEIDSGRRFARSFGSCSVDEPVEDLEALGYHVSAR